MHPAPLHPAPMHPALIRAAESSGAGPYTLLLAVFLVLLAMFVLLSTVSHRQQNRVAAALGSLDRSFTAAAPTGTGDRLEGIPDGALRRLAELAGVGSGTLRIGVVEPNRLVVLATGADDLFERDGTAVAVARTALIDRIVEALRDPPPGDSVTCDALVGLGSGPAMADSDGRAAA